MLDLDVKTEGTRLETGLGKLAAGLCRYGYCQNQAHLVERSMVSRCYRNIAARCRVSNLHFGDSF
jgi:hypothetical protein